MHTHTGEQNFTGNVNPLLTCRRGWQLKRARSQPIALRDVLQSKLRYGNGSFFGKQETCHHIQHRKCPSRKAVVSSISQPEPATSSTTLQRLLSWLVAQGVEGIGREDSKLGICELYNGERGLVFLQDVTERTIVLEIPLKLALFGTASELAARLVKESAMGESSAYCPYIQALPDAVPSAYGSWSSSASKEMQLGAIPSFIQPFQDAGKGGDQIPDRNTRWAYSIVHSRSFVLPGGKADELAPRFLLPLADMFNHGGDTSNFLVSGTSCSTENIRWDLVQSENAHSSVLQFRTVTSAEEGEEALISYGDKSSWEFLLFYGFVPIRNVHDKVSLWNSLEEAVDWFLAKLPARGTPEDRRKQALSIAESSSTALPAVLENDAIAGIQHRAIIVTAKMELDARMMDAFAFLVKEDSADGDIIIADSKARKAALSMVVFRIGEKLFSPQVTPLLTDLKLLEDSNEEEDDREYYVALQRHYSLVAQKHAEELQNIKVMALADSQDETIHFPQDKFDQSLLPSLRYRAQQKQVLWEVLVCLMQPP